MISYSGFRAAWERKYPDSPLGEVEVFECDDQLCVKANGSVARVPMKLLAGKREFAIFAVGEILEQLKPASAP